MSQPGFRAPTEAEVVRALASLSSINHRRIFFGKLENSLWLDPLARRGVFSAIREPATEADDADLRWPEGDYLVRMAGERPEAVTRILLDASETRNPYVRQAILKAALQLPPSQAAHLVRPLRAFIAEDTHRWLSPRDLSNLCIRLLGERLRRGWELADTLYWPRPAEGGLAEVTAGLERYWYAESLPAVARAMAAADSAKALKELGRWLVRYVHLTSPGALKGEDYSYLWRPEIRGSAKSARTSEIGDALVDAVRDVGLEMVERAAAADVVGILDPKSSPLMKRISMTVVAQAISSGQSPGAWRSWLLDRPTIHDLGVRPEYSELAREMLPRLDDADLTAWIELVRAGPELTEDQRRRLESERDPGAILERYERDLLAAVGSEAIGQLGAERLHALVGTHGEPSDDVRVPFATSVAVWEPEELPEEATRFGDMHPDEVAAALNDPAFQARLDQWDHHQVARQLGKAAAADPETFSRHALAFAATPPALMWGLFDGLTEAVRSGGSPPEWQNLIRLIERTEDVWSVEEGSQLVSSWARLIEAALRQTTSGLSRTQGEACARLLVVAHRSIEPRDTPGSDEGMDPLTDSLNWPRPIVVRGLVRLVSWGRDNGFTDDAMNVLLGALEAALESPDLAERAAIGEGLGVLVGKARSWFDEHLDELVGVDDQRLPTAFQDVVWTTALAVYRPSVQLLDALRPALHLRLALARAGYEPTAGWRNARPPGQLIGDHCVLLFAHALIEGDDPLFREFFLSSSAEDVAAVLSHWGWLLFRSEDPLPTTVIERSRALWESQMEAVAGGEAPPEVLSGFLWWVRSGLFSSEWWIPRLVDVCQMGVLDLRGGVEVVLEDVSGSDPAAALDLLAGLHQIDPRRSSVASFGWAQVAPLVIARALGTGDQALEARARRVMNQLGESGLISLAEDVRNARDSPGAG